jgi:hypothetical protein
MKAHKGFRAEGGGGRGRHRMIVATTEQAASA